MDVGYQLRSLVAENLNLKLLSFAFALVLYSLVHGSQDAQRSLLLSVVTLTPHDDNRILMTPIPPQIHVTVRGPRQTLDDLRADDIGSVQIDLRNGKETRVTFLPSMVPIPPGVNVEQIDPPAIDLAWEDVVVREVEVEVGVVGAPAPGFVLKGAPVVEPKAVRARGPSSEVAVVQRARLDPFDVTGLTEGKFTRQLALNRPLGRVTFEVPSVAATVEVARQVVERSFPRVPVALIGRTGVKAQPAEVDVRLACPPEIVRSLRPEQIVPRAQVVDAADHGAAALPVELAVDQCDVHMTPTSVIVRW
ncbi:MAG: CdaR family protein [Polyangiaceae bacterium]|jgi:hypothetical protein